MLRPETQRRGANPRAPHRALAVLAVAALLAACDPSPTAPSQGIQPTAPSSETSPPSETASPTSPGPTDGPSPSLGAGPDFPLAVVTGLTNLKAVVAVEELVHLAGDGELVIPCGIQVTEPALPSTAPCVAADGVAAALEADQELVALLPPGLVEPATKVLPIAGDGPFGLFGPDLFGDPEARALPYPVIGSATGDPALDPAWTVYDASQVWTMTSIGSLCSDREAAKQAVSRGKGWGWVFGGGTARYKGPPSLNPNPPPGIDQNLYVRPEATGNDGVVAAVQRRADVAIADHECPIMPNSQWSVGGTGGALSFSVPEAVVPEWKDTLGIDVVYLAANHMSDRGVDGIRSTLRLLDKHGLKRTGLGMTLDEGLKPAFVDVAGLKVGFVAWNDVGGVARADADTAGVPWITKANITEGVRRAHAGGADLVFCDPQWWGGREYHNDLLAKQVKQLRRFDAAGCDHVVGSGTHVAGPMLLRQRSDGVSLVLACPGNYVFGQNFFQDLQEGVILEQKFVGKRLVNARLHPYVIILGARPSLTDPEGDGRYVLRRIYRNSDLDYTP